MNTEYLKLDKDLVFNWFETLFIASIEKLSGKKIENVKLDYYKQEFIKTFFVHFISVKKIYRGIEITCNKKRNKISVLSAVLTLIRSCLENFAVFNYIYIETQNIEAIEYRFWSWWREGLLNRQKYFAEDKESKEKQLREKNEINSIYNNLMKTKYFNQLSQKQKEKYRKDGKWHYLGYKDLLNKAGFTEVCAKNMYSYLSSFSHSTSISLLQTSQANYDTSLLIQKTIIDALFIASALYL